MRYPCETRLTYAMIDSGMIHDIIAQSGSQLRRVAQDWTSVAQPHHSDTSMTSY